MWDILEQVILIIVFHFPVIEGWGKHHGRGLELHDLCSPFLPQPVCIQDSKSSLLCLTGVCGAEPALGPWGDASPPKCQQWSPAASQF